MKRPPFGPITFGKKTFPINVFYAPLAGCSDFPFRRMASRFKPGLIFSEMVKMDALIRNDVGTFHLLDYNRDMHPIGGQVCGSKPQIAGKAAKIIEDLGFDTVDLNCGCPVDKVTKDGSGSGLLKNVQLIGDVLSNMVASVKIPVSVKIRVGWDEDCLVFEDIVRTAEKVGASCITVHARTREQAYKGPANWKWIEQAKNAATSIKVIGNGDIYSAQDALRMLEVTGCDGVLVARGTLGQPWIAQDARTYIETGHFPPPKSLEERRKELALHFEYIKQYLPDRRVIIDMRRVGCWYFKRSQGTKAFREAISHANTLDEIESLIHNFYIDESEGDDLEASEG